MTRHPEVQRNTCLSYLVLQGSSWMRASFPFLPSFLIPTPPQLYLYIVLHHFESNHSLTIHRFVLCLFFTTVIWEAGLLQCIESTPVLFCGIPVFHCFDVP